MSATPLVKCRIDADGNLHVDVAGVPGATCENLTASLVASIGEVEQRCYTEEYTQELPDYVEAQTGEE